MHVCFCLNIPACSPTCIVSEAHIFQFTSTHIPCSCCAQFSERVPKQKYLLAWQQRSCANMSTCRICMVTPSIFIQKKYYSAWDLSSGNIHLGSLMKSRKEGHIHFCHTTNLVHDVTDTDCQDTKCQSLQVVMTFKCRFLTNQTMNWLKTAVSLFLKFHSNQ